MPTYKLTVTREYYFSRDIEIDAENVEAAIEVAYQEGVELPQWHDEADGGEIVDVRVLDRSLAKR